jgi:hypothetical protein
MDIAIVRQLLFVEKVNFRRKKDDVSFVLFLPIAIISFALIYAQIPNLTFSQDANTFQDSEQSKSLGMTKSNASEEDVQLENAATIGTALMLVNSHRALFILYVLVAALIKDSN